MKFNNLFSNDFIGKITLAVKQKKVWIPGLIILIPVVGFLYSGRHNSQVSYVTDVVKKGDIKQTVSATGTVQSAEELELSFKNTGWVSDILAAVGEQVGIGDELIKLDSSAVEISVRQAEANVVAAQATLNKMIAGASSEDIKVAAESVEKAQVSYNTAVKDLSNLKIKLDQDLNTYEKAVVAAEDNLTAAKISYDNTVVSQAQNVGNLIDSSLGTAESQIYSAESALGTIRTIFDKYESTGYLGNLDHNTYTKAKDDYIAATTQLTATKIILSQTKTKTTYDNTVILLDSTITLLKAAIIALNSAYDMMAHTYQVTPDLTAATIESYKTSIKADQATMNTGLSTAQTAKNSLVAGKQTEKTAIDTAASNVTSATNSLNTAKANLAVATASKQSQLDAGQANVNSTLAALNFAKAQYNQTAAPTRPEDITSQKASVSQLLAALDLAKNNLADQTIKSPIEGVVTKINYEVGEQVSLAKSAVGVIGDEKLEIEVDIPESDIVKIKLRDQVKITLDAYGDDYPFFGQVVSIEPAETVISDVVYYKVKVAFDCPENNNLNSSADLNVSAIPTVNSSVNTNNNQTELVENTNLSNGLDQRASCLAGVKSGMSANIVISTANRTGVLIAPQRAILSRDDGSKYVRVLNDKNYSEVDVTVGLRGDNGVAEILSGLNEGEEIVTYVKNGK